MRRNLVKTRVTQPQAMNLVNAMLAVFPGASVPGQAIGRLEISMTNHAKDRHVLAAAVAAPAEAIVTFNMDDFPDEACAPHGVTPIHPDDFMMTLHDIAPAAVAQVVTDQAADLVNPPFSRAELLGSLARAGVPMFARAAARH